MHRSPSPDPRFTIANHSTSPPLGLSVKLLLIVVVGVIGYALIQPSNHPPMDAHMGAKPSQPTPPSAGAGVGAPSTHSGMFTADSFAYLVGLRVVDENAGHAIPADRVGENTEWVDVKKFVAERKAPTR
jgi:hypothetical protein